jgi:hypothetical protein
MVAFQAVMTIIVTAILDCFDGLISQTVDGVYGNQIAC